MYETLSMGMGRPIPPPLPEPDDYTVDFDGMNDPMHPYNWQRSTKLFASILVCSGTLVVSYTSAIFAPAINSASKEFGVGSEVGTLGTTLYVLGFASGPVIWAPWSELRGRKWPLTISMLLGGIFTIASALAKDIQTLIICRFFAGVCGAGQLTVVPGLLTDIFDNTYRGVAITLYALTVFVGPVSAPFAGGFIVSSSLGWRWTLYLPAFLSFANGGISFCLLRETYAPCLLIAKAAAIRRQTNSWGIHARHDRIEVDPRELIDKYFTRPLKMLITEPIIFLVSLYMSFIYGLVYCLLEAYPYVFEEIYGFTPGFSGLPSIGLIIGLSLGCSFILSQQATYVKKLEKNGNVPVPEWRLVPTLVGAPVFAIGIFWFGWTGFTPRIHWAAPTVAGIFIGFGVLCVFLPCFNYLVDSYLPLAASTVAANIILRSSVAAGFPLFSKQMFENMGVQWACKGKLVDILCASSHICARSAGGNNAGHTIVANGITYDFHMLPSGLVNPKCMNLIGSGVVVHMPSFFKELADLKEKGLDTEGRIYISDRAHVVFDLHQLVDGLEEQELGKGAVGTTKKGIGPSYSTKSARSGVRISEIFDKETIDSKLRTLAHSFQKRYGVLLKGYDVEEEILRMDKYRSDLQEFVIDAIPLIESAQSSNDTKILVEGANALMLDVDYGTYPYVTSSNTGIGGVFTGLAINPFKVKEIIGVVKAYTTRVGGGPLPTEQLNEQGEKLQSIGREFGVTTGRKRRCGWLDLVIVKYSTAINHYTALNLTKLDILDDFPTIEVATAYKIDGKELESFPADLNKLARAEIVYTTLPGWQKPSTGAKAYYDLPKNARAYVEYIEAFVGVKVKYIGTGPAREDMIVRA